MHIETFEFTGVREDGRLSNGEGRVHTAGFVLMSGPQGGSESAQYDFGEGHWIAVLMPRTAGGAVAVHKIVFADKKELYQFLINREIEGTAD